MKTGNPSPQTRLTRQEIRQLIEDFWGEDIARDWNDSVEGFYEDWYDDVDGDDLEKSDYNHSSR